jgi:glycosyltransferase involved in cell wall biosynthesis
VFVIGSFWPEINGLQRSTERLATQLVRLGHDVRIVTQLGPSGVRMAQPTGLTVHRYEAGTDFTSSAAEAGQFDGADVLCVFGVGNDPAAAWWRPVLDARLAHHGVRLLKPGTDGDVTRAQIPGSMYIRFDGVLCQTRRIASEAQALGVPSGSCFAVRNGLDVETWRDALPSQQDARLLLALPDAGFVVLDLGRFIRRKRFPDLLRSFARFASESRPPRRGDEPPVLLLHGSGFARVDSDEAELRGLAKRLMPSADVRFVPPTVDPRLTLAAADVLAVLSEREGAPNVFVEAFASKRPVIATDLVGHRVYVHHGREGLLVPVGDQGAVVASLRRLHDQPGLLSHMSRAAFVAAAHFDVSSTAGDYLHAFTTSRQRRACAPQEPFREHRRSTHQAYGGELEVARHRA